MTVEEELIQAAPDADMALTVGICDGVHLGHRELARQVTGTAAKHGLKSGVVTFRQHPEAILAGKNVPFLTDLSQRQRLLKEAGIDIVVPLDFTRKVAALNARDFLALLVKHLRMKQLVIGYDFTLGKGGEGNIDRLRKLGEEMGFGVSNIPPFEIDGEVVSSTLIRNTLAAGDMPKVRRLLGRDFSLHGSVVTGASRGSWLGYPTANLEIPPDQAMPPDGVYATRAYFNDQSHAAMTYIGTRPTFKEDNRVVEVYLLDFKGDLYEQQLKIDVVAVLRGEQKFDNIEDLKEQIARDVARGREILSQENAK
jgi:riboflavin kinase / FMN adenylyltransferase